MNIQDYINSGLLELYVAGVLSPKENEEVTRAIQKHPELLKEVEIIEKTVKALTAGVAPEADQQAFTKVLMKTLQEKENATQVISLNTSKSNWIRYSGWAASLLIGSTLVFSVINNNSLSDQLSKEANEKLQFEQQLEKAKSDLATNEKVLNVIRDKNIIAVPLAGQKVAPEAYAKIYWDKKTQSIYLDAKGLPDPPKGKVYQLWSLKLNPLTPTSLGTIDSFISDANKIFAIDNPNDSQAFGITLEPEGGSKTPTLEQLYTLGAVES